MGKMTRRWRRQARRRLGEIVDKVYFTLEHLAEEAQDLDDQDAIADCEEALDAIDATLTPDGLPTLTTADVLPGVVLERLARVMRRLHPELSTPSDAENAA
jgi:hypothetical protein